MVDDVRAGARAYQEIKQAILAGELRLRQRLDIEMLAQRFQVSATPVRQALAILSTERLVSPGSARGYRVAFWSEADLAALYLWRGQLARLAAETYSPTAVSDALWRAAAHEDGFVALMRHLAKDAHGEIQHAAAGADERLRAALRAEPHVMPNTAAELAALARAMTESPQRTLMLRLKRYFQRRIQQAGAIRAAAHARAMPSNGD
jgi:DNA-binding GntR family transcriptional regulator